MTVQRPARIAPTIELVEAATRAARTVGRPDLANSLATQRLYLDETPCNLLVVGEFNKGKSALINALLGLTVCGVDPIRPTAVPTYIRYGPTAVAATGREPDKTHP